MAASEAPAPVTYRHAWLCACQIVPSSMNEMSDHQYNLWVYCGMLNGLLQNYAQIQLKLEPLMHSFQLSNNVSNRKETCLMS